MRIVGVLIAIGILGVGYFWMVLNWNYSTGERAGWVQKLSKKGWLCKTWEGELAMATMPGVVPEKFLFSTRDDAIAVQVNGALGKRVRIRYAQHKGVPTTCFGETEFFVGEAQPVE